MGSVLRHGLHASLLCLRCVRWCRLCSTTHAEWSQTTRIFRNVPCIYTCAQGDTPFEENTVLAWLTQMLMGLRHVHNKHILHRDLKTQNVFLTNHNVVKLGDFGIAKILDGTLEQAATVVGTPFYMSPEACQNQPYTYSSDMYVFVAVTNLSLRLATHVTHYIVVVPNQLLLPNPPLLPYLACSRL